MIDFSAVMEVLKNGSDQDIVAGMKTGSIPSQMAIAELQDRAKTRTASAGQPAQQGMNDALEMNAQVGPQQDVASQPQMQTPPKVQGMAAGGLVSFKHGGQIRGFAKGGMTEEEFFRGADYPNLLAGGFSPSVLSPTGTGEDITDLGAYAPYDPNKLYGARPVGNTGFSYEAPHRPQDIFDNWKSLTPAEKAKAKQKMPAAAAKNDAPLVLDSKYEAQVGDGGGARVGRRAGTAGGVGIGSFDIPEVRLPDAPNYDKYRDLTDEASAGKSYDEGVGANDGLAKRESRIADKEAALARDSERAPWLALMKAGLGMASSKNRSLFGAAGEGGIAGLNDYTTAQEGLNRRDDALFERRSQVEDAARADKLARFGFVQGAVSKAGDTNRTLGVKGLEQGYEGSLKGMDLNARRNETIAKLKQDDVASRRSYDASMASVSAQRAASAKLSDQERFFQRALKDPSFLKKDAKGNVIPDIEKIQTTYFTGKGAAQIYGTDQRGIASERAGLIKLLASEYDPVQRAILQQQLDSLGSGGTGSPYIDTIPANAQIRK